MKSWRLLFVAICMAWMVTQAEATPLLYDDFESGLGNWTKYPGTESALLLYGPDASKSIAPGPSGVHEGCSGYPYAYRQPVSELSGPDSF